MLSNAPLIHRRLQLGKPCKLKAAGLHRQRLLVIRPLIVNVTGPPSNYAFILFFEHVRVGDKVRPKPYYEFMAWRTGQ